jgi:ABC-type lipoprotein release transport system permease subunit
LIGTMSGIVVLLMINTARAHNGTADTVRVIGQVGVVLGLWFGATWLGTQLIDAATIKKMSAAYFATLAVTFLVCIWPALRAARRDIGQGKFRGD